MGNGFCASFKSTPMRPPVRSCLPSASGTTPHPLEALKLEPQASSSLVYIIVLVKYLFQ